MAENDLHKSSNLDQCRIIEFDKHHHPNGNLSAVENGEQVPFDIKRVFYIYDVPGGEERGGHSHKELQQVIIAISGAFDVLIDDGVIAPGIWSQQLNFSSGSVCLVIASDNYNEDDYVRDYEEFKQLTSSKI